MDLEVVKLTMPDALGGGVGDVEALHALVDGCRPAERFVLDMRQVGFVKPYGVVALLLTARRLAWNRVRSLFRPIARNRTRRNRSHLVSSPSLGLREPGLFCAI